MLQLAFFWVTISSSDLAQPLAYGEGVKRVQNARRQAFGRITELGDFINAAAAAGDFIWFAAAALLLAGHGRATATT